MGGLRTSTSSAFALLALPFLYATQHMPVPGLPPLAAAYFLLGLFVNGPKTLSGIALRQLVPPSMAGTAMGVQGLVGQVGASWAGAPVGFVAQHWGWGAIKHLWAASLLAAAGCLSVPGLLVKARRVAAQQRERQVSLGLGLEEGPLLKLFNYYLPPTPEERAKLEAKRAAQQAQRAQEEQQAARAERRRRRAERRSQAASTLQGLLRRRRRRQQDEDEEHEQEHDLLESEAEEEEEQQLQQLDSEDAPEPSRRGWLSSRRTKPEEEEDEAGQHQQPPSEQEEEVEGGDESALTLRQRITRRARRMRRRLREAVSVTTTGGSTSTTTASEQ